MKIKIHISILVFVFLLIQTQPVIAEPSKNMRGIINDTVSVLDFICYKLDLCLNNNPPSSYLKRLAVEKGVRNMRTLRTLGGNVTFDYASNRLNINIEFSPSGGRQKFEQFWQEEHEVFSLDNSRRVKVPMYEAFRLETARWIKETPFHIGYINAAYKEDTVKNELIERMKITINYYNSLPIPGFIFMEYSDGTWKKMELSPKLK